MNVLLKQFQPHLFIVSAINISNKEISQLLLTHVPKGF